MKAARQRSLGGPEVLEVVDQERPHPRAGEVVVRVERSSLNPTDVKHRELGRYLGDPPFTLGWDAAGYVESCGEGVAHLREGDRVFGMLPYPYGAGAHAEFVAAPSRCFVEIPESIGLDHAGVAPLVGLTAYQAVLEIGRVRAGDTVLIDGARGAVGTAATMIARSRGARVIGIVSELCHRMPVTPDEVWLRSDEAWYGRLGEVDCAIDTVVAASSTRLLRSLVSGSRYVSLLPPLSDVHELRIARDRGVDARTMLVSADHGGMSAVAGLMDAGALSFEISRSFPLDEIQDAHRYFESSMRSRGRVCIRIA